MRRRVMRYSAIVRPMAREGGRWSVRVQVSNEPGTIVRHALLDSRSFRTRHEADAAGWRVVDVWIRRLERAAA